MQCSDDERRKTTDSLRSWRREERRRGEETKGISPNGSFNVYGGRAFERYALNHLEWVGKL